jgi:hypothetical protein
MPARLGGVSEATPSFLDAVASGDGPVDCGEHSGAASRRLCDVSERRYGPCHDGRFRRLAIILRMA